MYIYGAIIQPDMVTYTYKPVLRKARGSRTEGNPQLHKGQPGYKILLKKEKRNTNTTENPPYREY